MSDSLDTEHDCVPQTIVEEVSTRWEKLPIHTGPFAAYARERNVDLQRVPKEIGADLYLAFACFSQFSGAIEQFCERYGVRIRATGRSFGGSEAFADEVLQRVLERLFVSSPERALGIGQYRAEAPLAAWVNTIARRLAVRQIKSTHPERFLDEELLINEMSEACDQELALLKAQHREVVRLAMLAALKQMPKREQRFLQLNLVAGISMSRIGKIYGMSQSSISRKIQRAMRNVVSAAKKEVRRQVQVSSDELESIFRMIQSCIELSVTQFSAQEAEVVPQPAISEASVEIAHLEKHS